jgi:hypothetical protein
MGGKKGPIARTSHRNRFQKWRLRSGTVAYRNVATAFVLVLFLRARLRRFCDVQVKYRSSVQYRPPRASSLRLEWLGSQVLARQVCCAVLLSLRSRPEAVTAIRTPLCMEITSPRVATTSQGYSLVWLVRQNGACHLTAASRICASQFFLLCVQVSEPWSQLCHTCSKWTSMRAREPSGVLA